jgi:hypothetical protein
MEDLYELRTYIETGKYQEALLLLDEMEDMSQDDKINRISSFIEVLLVHFIKQVAEKKTTRSWEVSMRHALRQIVKINKRRKAGGWYLTTQELRAALEETYEAALDSASLETLAGPYTAEELDSIVDRTAITALAWEKIQHTQIQC